jgi:hypothetical protein
MLVASSSVCICLRGSYAVRAIFTEPSFVRKRVSGWGVHVHHDIKAVPTIKRKSAFSERLGSCPDKATGRED